jgi:hypothetical protein
VVRDLLPLRQDLGQALRTQHIPPQVTEYYFNPLDIGQVYGSGSQLDPDPGGQKGPTKVKNKVKQNSCFEMLDVLF